MATIGKLVQVVKKPLSDEFETIYGMECGNTGRCLLDFAEVMFNDASGLSPTCYIQHAGYEVLSGDDNFKQILIYNGRVLEEDEESYLLVVVPFGLHGFSSTAKRIAGRYPYEAILEMHEGDILEVTPFHCGKVGKSFIPSQKFVATRAFNEMFLVKKTRP